MTRISVFIRIPSDDAFELKAQSLNNDPRLPLAGIAALKFVGDKQYIVDGNFSPELPPQDTVEVPTTDSNNGGELHVFVRIPNDDSYELQAQALNKNPLLKKAGISGLRRVGDKQYIVDGDFSPELPPQGVVETPEADSNNGEELHVFVRIPNDDSYELKAQALNKNPLLKKAGILGLRIVGDKQYIVNGEFTSTLPASHRPELKSPKPLSNEKLRVTIRMKGDDAYQLIADHLNRDPRLQKVGISDIKLVQARDARTAVALIPVESREKVESVVPIANQPDLMPVPITTKKKQRSRGCLVWALLLVTLGIIFTAGRIVLANGLVPDFLATVQMMVVPSSTTVSPVPPTEITPTVSMPTSSPTPSRTATPTPARTQTTTATLEFIFTAEKNVFCRTGPSTLFEGTEIVSAGASVPIRGYSTSPIDNDAVWWLVFVDEEECYVSASGGTASIPLDELTFLEPQPGTPSVQATQVTFIEPPLFKSSIAGAVYSYYYGTDYPYQDEIVELYAGNCNGTPLLESVTNSGGYYGFSDIPAGDYCVRVVTDLTYEPGGYLPQLQVSVAEDDSAYADFPLSDP